MPIHRRSSGSLSPRLIQFKRRESIDNIINEEKNHEHEVNDVNNLNCKVEDLLGKLAIEFLVLKFFDIQNHHFRPKQKNSKYCDPFQFT